MWHLPINDEHRASIKPPSQATDIKNIGRAPYGGACTAAAFLECFVEEGVKWAHLDIAGPTCLRGGPRPKGCDDQSGFGAALLLSLLAGKGQGPEIKLFWGDVSQPARGYKAFLTTCRIPHDEVNVNLFKGEHK